MRGGRLGRSWTGGAGDPGAAEGASGDAGDGDRERIGWDRGLTVLTMACGYSRWLSAVMVPSRRSEDLFAGWWQLIEKVGAVPRALVWDSKGAIGEWRPASR
jgi:hypothetical protein